tara:strand:+ start:417 stop:722 length:306 start_codon:yes stop_codon:yes gene_type:complete
MNIASGLIKLGFKSDIDFIASETGGIQSFVWLSEASKPTDAEIENASGLYDDEYDANQYQRDRQYPSIGDQLDMQYHDLLNGTTTWKDAIAKVKTDIPKPE